MKHFGQLLRKYLDLHEIQRRDFAIKVGISESTLYSIFRKPTIDCMLMEKICKESGMPVTDFLEGVTYNMGATGSKTLSDNKASTFVGNASVHLGATPDFYEKLLAEKDRIIAEKERYINILEKLCPALCPVTESEQPAAPSPLQS